MGDLEGREGEIFVKPMANVSTHCPVKKGPRSVVAQSVAEGQFEAGVARLAELESQDVVLGEAEWETELDVTLGLDEVTPEEVTAISADIAEVIGDSNGEVATAIDDYSRDGNAIPVSDLDIEEDPAEDPAQEEVDAKDWVQLEGADEEVADLLHDEAVHLETMEPRVALAEDPVVPDEAGSLFDPRPQEGNIDDEEEDVEDIDDTDDDDGDEAADDDIDEAESNLFDVFNNK